MMNEIPDYTIDYTDNIVPLSMQQTLFSDFMRADFLLGWKDWEFDKDVFLYSHLENTRAAEVLDFYAQKTYSHLIGDRKLHRVILNCGLPGAMYKTHCDDCFANEDTITILYMANQEWKHGWGGEFKYYHPMTRELVHCIDYKPGRFVAFDGRWQHTAGTISYSASFFRFTVALMYANE